MKSRRILFICIITEVLIISILFFVLFNNNLHIAPPLASKIFNPSLEKREWGAYMQKVGTTRAYDAFLKQYAHISSYTIQHAVMHIIGELIFEQDGIKGVVVCDDSIGYGCYHGFFATTIKKTGFSKLHDIDDICFEHYGSNASGCQHGIGHGIMTYEGENNLVKALSVCSTLRPTGGCYDGVFMEYSFGNFSHNGLLKARTLDIDNPYEPCNRIPEKYQWNCYYQQVNWWESVYHKDYKKMGELCEEIPSDNKKSCYLGIGNFAVKYSDFDIKKTLEKCNAISSEYGNFLCKAKARTVYVGSKRSEDFSLLCKSVRPLWEKSCVRISEMLRKGNSPKNDLSVN